MKGILNKLDNGWMLLIDNVIYATDNDKLSLKNCQAIELCGVQQTKWDVEVEMWFHGTRHKKGEWIPKLDSDGCLILKK